MRNDVGEVLAVTHRQQLETVGNVPRFALSWTDGLWHEPVNARPVSRHDAAKAPLTRNYHPTESPSGVRIPHRVTDAGIVVTVANRDRCKGNLATTQDVTLAPQRDTWQLLSVHAAAQKTCGLISEQRVAVVWTKCAVCKSQRNFTIGVWTDLDTTLGCFRCTRHVTERKIDNAPRHTPDTLPKMHGLYQMDRVTMGMRDGCETIYVAVVWATCTGACCGGYKSSFSASKWADLTSRLACNRCHKAKLPGFLSTEKRDAIKERLLRGESYYTLARVYGVHKSTTFRILTQLREGRGVAVPAHPLCAAAAGEVA